MSKFVKIPLAAAGLGVGFFVGTFTIYMFNLDMKATSLVAPLLEKWYDSRTHEFYI